MWAALRQKLPRAAVDQGEQRAALRRKLDEVDALLEEERAGAGGTAPEDRTVLCTSSGRAIATGLSDRCVVRFLPGTDDDAKCTNEVLVRIGTSEDADVPGRVQRISEIVNSAYSAVGKGKRMDRYDVLDRLEMGDAGVRANRVLHLAYKGGELVGCASSTFSPGWTHQGCGHWGLLAVDPAHQSGGVATALVLAAERRLATTCEAVQIEYNYTEGEAFSQQLMRWYEDKLGFQGGPRRQRPGTTSFRRCLKSIPSEEQQRGRQRRLEDFRKWLTDQLIEAGGSPTEGDEGAAGKQPSAVGKAPSLLSASTASPPASSAAKNGPGVDVAMDDSDSDSEASDSSSAVLRV